jgi:thiazole synthase ThiGH ThiG subunit
MIQAFAAEQLAKVHDKASIPLIVDACRRAPAGAAQAIASGLSAWNDPDAQKAAKEFSREKKSH